MAFYKVISQLIKCMLLLSLIACHSHTYKSQVVCPKIQLEQRLYCSIPFVEMQANYNNLDGLAIAVSGTLSIMQSKLLLVVPFSKDYDIPQHYNSVVLEANLTEVDLDNLRELHGQQVLVFGIFYARNHDSLEWPGADGHVIKEVKMFPAH